MKKLVTGFCFFFSMTYCYCQNQDNFWLLGIQTFDWTYPKGGIVFNSNVADTFQHTRPMGFYITNASICDTNGQLLFYSNGVYIENKNHDTLLNSIDFNPGTYTDFYSYLGIGFMQSAIILPVPDQQNLFDIFYVSGEDIYAYGQWDVQPLYLSYSEVDMDLDSGLGGIPMDKKNIKIVNDTISQGRITACKHANGRDWWVIIHKYYSDIFYKLLLTPDSIYGPYQQQIGSIYTSNDIFGMGIFSPDGEKYVTIQNNNSAEIYDFDRCTGEFSNPFSLSIPDVELTLGGAISANNRFLYVNTYASVFQLDLWSNDIQNSVIKVASWDSSYLPVATYFFMPQFAPDNKIYISTFNSTRFLHVIESPDSQGLSCNFVQHGFPLSKSSYNVCIPNFPNYDLGSLEGSGCDTLATSINVESKPFSSTYIYPNPASEIVNIVYQLNDIAILELTDVSGAIRKSLSLYPYFKNRLLLVNDLENGIYFYTVKAQDKLLQSGKIAIIR